MRRPAAAILLACALAAGCGGDEGAAQDTVSAAVSGVAVGDEQRVCEQLTPAAQKKLLAALADNPLGYPDIRAKTCEDAIRKLHAQLPATVRAVLEDGETENAVVDGDTATVVVTGAGMKVQLRKLDGDWKITGGLLGG